MKSITLFLFLLLFSVSAHSQSVGEKWMDVNYAGDTLSAHTLDVYLPNGNQPSYHPIVIIYGSAWFSDEWKGVAFNQIGQPLLDAGFAVVSINHRSSRTDAFPAQIQDVKAAIRFVRANAADYNLNTSFLGITGYSSGGHLSSLAGVTNGISELTEGNTTLNIEGTIGDYTSTSSNVDAVVDWFGPVDMARMQDCSTVKGLDSPEAVIIGGAPKDLPDMVTLLSPINYVDENDPPFLVIHGDSDDIVSHCQSVFFSEELDRKGVLEEFISVPGGKHGPVTFNEETFKSMTDFFTEKAGN